MSLKMITNDIANCTEFKAIVINELRESYGIKYRRDKKHKSGPVKPLAKCEKQIVIVIFFTVHYLIVFIYVRTIVRNRKRKIQRRFSTQTWTNWN